MIEISVLPVSSFQTVFHEASHTLRGPGDRLRLRCAYEAENSRMMIAHGAHCSYYLNQPDHKYFSIPAGLAGCSIGKLGCHIDVLFIVA